jgi:Beta-lactamase
MNPNVRPPVDHAPPLGARVDAILKHSSAVGLAVGVVRNGRLEFFSGQGLANIALRTPITPDTVFRIASITKTFTAIAVLQLWEQGLINLDGPANDYLRTYLGGHLAVEHDGLLSGFDSQIYLAPDDGVGVLAFASGARLGFHWLAPEIGGMLRQLLGVADDVIRTDVPQHPEIWGELCGWYRYSASWTDPGKLAIGPGARVLVRRNQLWIHALSPVPALYQGFALHPDDENDPYVFRIDLSKFGLGTYRVVFSREPGAGTTAVHLEFGPLSIQKHMQAVRCNQDCSHERRFHRSVVPQCLGTGRSHPALVVAWCESGSGQISLGFFNGSPVMTGIVQTGQYTSYGPALSRPLIGWKPGR